MRRTVSAKPPALFAEELSRLIPPAIPDPLTGAIEKVLSLDRLNELYDSVRHIPGKQPFCEKLLDYLNVEVKLSDADRERVPVKGPVIAVANHPFGMIEGVVLAALLLRIRPDVKFMANHLLASVPELLPTMIAVDPFGTRDSVRSNVRGLKQTLEYLKDGGMLIVFPAGEVSHLDMNRRAITDPKWSPTIARIARSSKASVLPAYFEGFNSPLFHLAGMIHPLLRTAMLPHELLNKHDRTLNVYFGSVVTPRRLEGFPSDEEVTDYLRRRTYLLANRKSKQGLVDKLRSLRPPRRRVISAVSPDLMERDLATLPAENRLVISGEFDVFVGSMPQLPNVLREIARLREATFRDAGEGTGKPLDTDSFDAHYLHLFIWNREARQIVGAYRLGKTDEIRHRLGVRGLYTSGLFSYGEEFLDRIGTGLEMGRSFVRPEYQKSYNPLLLLWKGIAAYVVRHPRYHVLFGPVSISNDYSGASRQLIVQYLKEQLERTDVAQLVKPRSPFKAKRVKGWDDKAVSPMVCGVDELSAMIADIETDQKGVPVLLRQYLKLGGKLAGFNVDSAFSNALDGLIIVDLRETDQKVLERYMGKEGCATFRRAHGLMRPAVSA
jgi:putative hemolysin